MGSTPTRLSSGVMSENIISRREMSGQERPSASHNRGTLAPNGGLFESSYQEPWSLSPSQPEENTGFTEYNLDSTLDRFVEASLSQNAILIGNLTPLGSDMRRRGYKEIKLRDVTDVSSVCFCLEENSDIVIDCGHTFHLDCMKLLLEGYKKDFKEPFCPACKAPLTGNYVRVVNSKEEVSQDKN